MNYDKRKLYIFSAVVFCALLLVSLVPNTIWRRWILAVAMGVLAVSGICAIKKRSTPALESGQVTWLLPLIGAVAVMILYITGLKFGFTRVTVKVSVLWQTVLPYCAAILCGEILRHILTAQKNKCATILSFVALVLADCAMLKSGNVFSGHRSLMSFLGTVLFPAISANLLYHYISARYTMWANVLYRVLISLYSVLLPVTSAMPVAMLSFGKIILPLAALLFLRTLYEKRKFAVSRKVLSLRTAVTGVIVVVMALTMMLISCRFQYGMLVIATESMTGTINKGDAIVYEAYDGQAVEVDQIAVFEKDGVTYVHRIVDIENINGEIRYYTKGDANPKNDTGYVTNENIVGLTDLTIKYIGFPTLWMRELLN